jgi:uncharacterized membrane protein YoaK (UPF0700 family)
MPLSAVVRLWERSQRLLNVGLPFILGIFAKRAETASSEYFTIFVVFSGGALAAKFVVYAGFVIGLRSSIGSTRNLAIADRIHNY